MKLLIVGSGGRLGMAMAREYDKHHDCLGLGRGEMDLSDDKTLLSVLGCHEFDVLINCAAMTSVDYAETHREEAFQVNANAPRKMAEYCAEVGARMIHISTDYVFDGEASEPLTEDDKADPISVYGESKKAGEDLVLDVSRDNLVVRVSWVFGPERPSFVEMITHRALENDYVEAIGDKFSSPAYTKDLVNDLEPLLQRRDVGGLLHLCNSGATTWQEYGQFAIDVAADCGVEFQSREVHGIKTTDLKNFIAKRPIYTVMDCSRYESISGRKVRSWQEAVEDYVRNSLAEKLKSNG